MNFEFELCKKSEIKKRKSIILVVGFWLMVDGSFGT